MIRRNREIKEKLNLRNLHVSRESPEIKMIVGKANRELSYFEKQSSKLKRKTSRKKLTTFLRKIIYDLCRSYW